MRSLLLTEQTRCAVILLTANLTVTQIHIEEKLPHIINMVKAFIAEEWLVPIPNLVLLVKSNKKKVENLVKCFPEFVVHVDQQPLVYEVVDLSRCDFLSALPRNHIYPCTNAIYSLTLLSKKELSLQDTITILKDSIHIKSTSTLSLAASLESMVGKSPSDVLVFCQNGEGGMLAHKIILLCRVQDLKELLASRNCTEIRVLQKTILIPIAERREHSVTIESFPSLCVH